MSPTPEHLNEARRFEDWPDRPDERDYGGRWPTVRELEPKPDRVTGRTHVPEQPDYESSQHAWTSPCPRCGR